MKIETNEAFRKYAPPAVFDRIREYDTVARMWQASAAQYADDIAIEDDGKTYTFARLDEDAARFRGILLSRGVKEGERVAILAPNSYGFVRAFLAVATLGCTAVVLPAQLDEMSVFGCLMKYGASALVYDPGLAEKTRIAAEKRPDIPLIPADEAGGEKAPFGRCEGATPCVVMFTGGTTGRSKGALLSNTAVMQGVVNGCYGYADVFSQRYLLVLPLSHVFGLIRNLLTSLYTGSALFICRNNKDMFRDIAMFRPTILVLVPALAEMALTLSKKFGRNMLGADLKYIICGAAAVAPYLVTEYQKLGVTLCPGYGLTESANLVSGNPESLKKPDSVGLPFPHQEFRVENGELWIKGLNMMDGYLGEEEENPYTDGWFRTGDLVRFDEDGFLYITGRIKEIIVLSNGENVSPAEVEAYFNALPCVKDSQVFEDIDETGNHILALEVVPREEELAGVPTERLEAYILGELERVNRELPPYWMVSRMTVRDSDFERTPSMKIKRYNKCS